MSIKKFITNFGKIFSYFFLDFRRTWKWPLVISVVFLFGVALIPNFTFAEDTAAPKGDLNIVPRGISYVTYTFSGDQGIGRSSNISTPLEGSVWKVGETVTPGSAGVPNLPQGFTYKYGGANTALMYFGGTLYDSPAATTPEYLNYVASNSNIGPAKTANAQVSGYEAFSPIITLWSFFRNISYVLFIAVFVISGFLILIQNKIGGREAVTFTSSLIPAIITLVFITFSYAIAGLIVDIFINLGNGIVASTFNQFINSEHVLKELRTPNSNVNILTIFNSMQQIGFGSAFSNLGRSVLDFLRYPTEKVNDLFGGVAVFGPFLGFISTIFTGILLGILDYGFNRNALIEAVSSFIVFITLIRVLLALISSYIAIVFRIMFAPIALLPAAFPGGGGIAVIVNWIKGLIASCLVFPAIFACILFVGIFLNLKYKVDTDRCYYVTLYDKTKSNSIPGATDSNQIFNTTPSPSDDSTKSGFSNTDCVPLALPSKFNVWPEPLGYLPGVDPDAVIRLALAFAFLLVMPTIPKILNDALGVKPNAALAGIGQGVKSGIGVFSGVVGSVPSLGIGKSISNLTGTISSSL